MARENSRAEVLSDENCTQLSWEDAIAQKDQYEVNMRSHNAKHESFNCSLFDTRDNKAQHICKVHTEHRLSSSGSIKEEPMPDAKGEVKGESMQNLVEKCLMCLHYFDQNELEKHLWECKAKLPCLGRIELKEDEILDIKYEMKAENPSNITDDRNIYTKCATQINYRTNEQMSTTHRQEIPQGMERKLPQESTEKKCIELIKMCKVEQKGDTNLQTMAPSIGHGVATHYVACKICSKLFSAHENLQKHVMLQHLVSRECKMNSVKLNEIVEKQTKHIKGRCEYCGHWFGKNGLSAHVSHCRKRGRQCKICLHWVSVETLQHHELICRPGGTCTFCAKWCSDKYLLMEHE